MDDARQVFFYNHPDPMWVFEAQTLRFLDVNSAAVVRYGYSREEFLAMTIADIRPPEDVDGLRVIDASLGDGLIDPMLTRHILKNDEVIDVQITGHVMQFEGRAARLICARDVSHLVELERARAVALEREEVARRAAERVAQRFESLFAAVPGKFLVLAPGDFEILAVSDAYLQATGNTRESLVGNPLFGSFDQHQSNLAPDGEMLLRTSLERVVATRRQDVMGVQAFPVRDPDSPDAGLVTRYWCAVNAPVLDVRGQIVYIFHKVEDVTDLARERSVDPLDIAALLDAPAAFELAVRSRALKYRAQHLEAQVAELRAAQQLLAMATWSLDLRTGRVEASGNFHSLLGTTPDRFIPTLEGYLQLVHPEDRAAMRASLAGFGWDGPTEYLIRQRVVRPDDGRTLHVMVVGECHMSAAGAVMSCIVQDITELFDLTQERNSIAALARIAGRAARLGGWRYDVVSGQLTWGAQTFAIYGMPLDAVPDIESAFARYAPEYRKRVRSLFDRCIRTGEPFDEVMQFAVAEGRHIWVRVIGEPEQDELGRIVAVQGAFQDVDELVRAQHQAESLSRTLAATLESISDAFFMVDEEWRFTYLNSQGEKLLARPRDALIGRVLWDEFPGATGTVFQTEYERVMRTGQTARFDQHYTPLGARFRVNAYRVPEGLAVYFSDITRQHEQESQLRLLQVAAERMSDMLVITEAEPISGPEGPRIVYVNEAFERRTGFSRAEVIGRTPRILQGARTQPEQLTRIREALGRWRSVRAELINYTRSGEEMWLELDIAPIADEKGWYTHWVAVERDVTDRRRADELARINDERFRLIAKATNDVVWDWDVVGGQVWWNENMTTLFGYAPEDLELGADAWKMRIHPDDRAQVTASLDRAIAGTATTWTSEYRFLHADGRALTVIDRGFLIRDESGRAVRMLGSIVDITRRLELDAQLRQSQKLEAVGHLTGGVAHDFNNLLTVILGNAAQLGELLVHEPRLHELARMTETAAARGAELINRMLAFSRRQALDPKVVDVERLVTGMEGLLRRTLPEDIELKVVPAPDVWDIEVDPGQLEVALLNLAVNARDAMPGGGSLGIATANVVLDDQYVRRHNDVIPGRYVMVSITDTGTGITPEVLPRVFDPFFTTKEVGKGSGLGLSMVYGFVKQSRGHIVLNSRIGEGTTVQLYFPCAEAAADRPRVVAQSRVLPRGSEHVLVVEDEALVRQHVVAQLRCLGYRVTHACSGQHALELLPGLPDVALLFTDVVMPGGMSGSDLAREVRRRRPEMKVLFTSGYAETAIVHDGRLDPAVQLLSKPYRRQELAERIRQALDAG